MFMLIGTNLIIVKDVYEKTIGTTKMLLVVMEW